MTEPELRAIYSSSHQAGIREAALVLTAMGIPHQVSHDDGKWLLSVEDRDEAHAERAKQQRDEDPDEGEGDGDARRHVVHHELERARGDCAIEIRLLGYEQMIHHFGIHANDGDLVLGPV